MLVTKYGYYMEKHLITVLDGLIKRCHDEKGKKLDTFLICEGQEGSGKTTMSIAVGYYVAHQTGRPFGAENLFFDIDKLLEFASSTEKQIIVFDEPALQMLSNDFKSKLATAFKRLMMMARKKRHFVIVNLTYFYRFDNYILDRANGMIRVYDKQGKTQNRFVYYKERKLKLLVETYFTLRKKKYNKFCSRYVRGTFEDLLSPDYKNNVLADFDLDLYERNKDEAISKVESGLKKNVRAKEIQLKDKIAELYRNKVITREDFVKYFKHNQETLYEWLKLRAEHPFLLEKSR